MRVCALCAVRERTRRVLVIFPCFSDFQAVFTKFRTFYETLFDLYLTFLWQKPLFRAYIFMSFGCSYFPLFLPFVSKNTGVRPEKVFKKSDFLHWSLDKRICDFFVTLTADEKRQFDADLSVYLRLQDSYMPYKAILLWPFWVHVQSVQSADIQRVAAQTTMWVIHK